MENGFDMSRNFYAQLSKIIGDGICKVSGSDSIGVKNSCIRSSNMIWNINILKVVHASLLCSAMLESGYNNGVGNM